MKFLAVFALVLVATPTRAQSTTLHHTVTASVQGSGGYASVVINDPFADRLPMVLVEYDMADGYGKVVKIAKAPVVVAEDVAECGTPKGKTVSVDGYVYTGLACKPRLHTKEVWYLQPGIGSAEGRRRPPNTAMVTEHTTGIGASGTYLTVGHIDHGSIIRVVYEWSNGRTTEYLTVHHPAGALAYHIGLTFTGTVPSAIVTLHPAPVPVSP